jgi:hypothetical protein
MGVAFTNSSWQSNALVHHQEHISAYPLGDLTYLAHGPHVRPEGGRIGAIERPAVRHPHTLVRRPQVPGTS